MKALLLAASCVCLMASAVSAEIVSTVPQVTEIAPPASAAPGASKDPNNIWVFEEQIGAQLASPLDVDITLPGTYASLADLTNPGTLNIGKWVDSHYVLWSGPAYASAGGSVTFSLEILGVMVMANHIQASHGLGAPGTYYPCNGCTMETYQGVDFNSDVLTVSADRHTLSLSLYSAFDEAMYLYLYPDVAAAIPQWFSSGEDHYNRRGAAEGRLGSPGDQIRVITNSLVPEPAALSLLLVGGVALLGRRRRTA